MKQNYVLVTPVKNEEAFLPMTISSVVKQTIQPVIWIIVDDGSVDKTPFIIQDAQDKYPWIKRLDLTESKWDLGIHLAQVVDKAITFALKQTYHENISYDFIGNLDGDLILEEDFYEKLMKELLDDSKLGVVSGSTFFEINGCTSKENVSIYEPSGGHMLIKRECFESCNGVTLSYSWDSTFKAKARLQGWCTKRIESAKATEMRLPSSSNGYWNGFVFHGRSAYYRNLHPLHILIKACKLFFRYPHYSGVAYLYGYLQFFVKQKNKIEDLELRNYYHNKIYEYIRINRR